MPFIRGSGPIKGVRVVAGVFVKRTDSPGRVSLREQNQYTIEITRTKAQRYT